MDNLGRRRAVVAVSVDVRHDVMAQLPFVTGRNVEVNRIDMSSHLVQLFIGDR